MGIRGLCKLPDGRDWLWGNLGLALVGRGMLSSVQFSHSVTFNYPQPHGLQHTRLPYPSSTLRACSHSCPSNGWYYLILSSPSPPAFNYSKHQGFFLMSQLFISGGQSIRVRFSISPSKKYSGMISFKIDWFDVFAVQGTLMCLLQHHSSKASLIQCSAFSWSNSHIHTLPLEKT